MADADQHTPEEADRRRDSMLLRALNTPPQPRRKRDRSKPVQKDAAPASEKRADS